MLRGKFWLIKAPRIGVPYFIVSVILAGIFYAVPPYRITNNFLSQLGQVYVFGEVFSSGAKRYDDKLSYKDYIVDFSGGYTPTADKGSTYIISPDGSASLVSKFGFSLIDSANEIYPGSIIYVAPKGVLGTQALNQQLQAVSTLALTLASLKSFSD